MKLTELHLVPAKKPTMYFIGVTTTKSMIMRVFPAWAKHLGFGDCQLKGIDLDLHDSPERYRVVVDFIKRDPLSIGALVTTHKIDLLHAAKNMFDELDDFASLMGEVSAIFKRDGTLCGGAKDAVTSGLALEAFVPPGHWESTRAPAFIMGAGGSSVALSSYIARPQHGARRPSRIIVSNRSPRRLKEMQEIHAQQSLDIPIEYVLTPNTEDNDAVLFGLPEGSLVVNGTGLGKDAPGSPLTDYAVFPRNGLVWDFNYRGNLLFLDQARCQAGPRNLRIEDGWLYFIYGWLAVIAEVFDRKIPSSGPEFEKLCRIAEREKKTD
jgi:shikimate 5-dehydrogenase